MLKIAKSEATVHGREGVEAVYYQLPDVLGGTTVATAKFTGEHGQSTIGQRPRIYIVQKGKGKFVINGETVMANEGDVVTIPAMATYNLWPLDGAVEIVLVCELLDLK